MRCNFSMSPSRLMARWLLLLLVALLVTSCGEANQSPSGSGSVANTTDESVVRFNGICDGSAAVRISDDHLLVAYDEQNSFYLFPAAGGRFVDVYPYAALLALENNSEVDLEAAAIAGNAIWWLGSHGLNGNARVAPNRRMLFQTTIPDIVSGELKLLRGPMDLTPLLLLMDNSTRFLDPVTLRNGPKKGGLNIEGLSIANNGDLLVGLRSPLSGGLTGDALVFQLTVTDDAINAGRIHRIDLGNRGVRDMVSIDDGYLLLAGDVASGGSFTVYQWSVDTPVQAVAEIPKGINAEAIVAFDNYVLVLSDDGKVKRRDSSAKDGDRRCDSIFKKNPQRGDHESVFFRSIKVAR